MALRLYLLPVVHLTSPVPYEVPKYLPHRFSPPLSGLEGVVWSWETYLLQDVGMAVAEVSTAQHTLLAAQSDVISVPVNLDSTIAQNVRNNIRAQLDLWLIPSAWVITGMSYRIICRTLLNIWQFHNRYVGSTGVRLFDGSLILATQWQAIPVAVQDGLLAAAASMNLNTSGLTPTTTVGQILKSLADQLGDIPYTIGPLTI